MPLPAVAFIRNCIRIVRPVRRIRQITAPVTVVRPRPIRRLARVMIVCTAGAVPTLPQPVMAPVIPPAPITQPAVVYGPAPFGIGNVGPMITNSYQTIIPALVPSVPPGITYLSSQAPVGVSEPGSLGLFVAVLLFLGLTRYRFSRP